MTPIQAGARPRLTRRAASRLVPPSIVHNEYLPALAQQMRRDVYNLDSRTLAAIRSERAIVEAAPEGKSEQVIASGGARKAGKPYPEPFFPSFFFAGRPLRPPRGIY